MDPNQPYPLYVAPVPTPTDGHQYFSTPAGAAPLIPYQGAPVQYLTAQQYAPQVLHPTAVHPRPRTPPDRAETRGPLGCSVAASESAPPALEPPSCSRPSPPPPPASVCSPPSSPSATCSRTRAAAGVQAGERSTST
ncbi:hypothetical protein ACFQ0T_19890 [Kitasatospora gansuensis]